MLRAVLVLVIASCGGAETPPPANHGGTPPALASRALTPRAELPAAIQPHLPVHGIYVAGGGLVSSAWRIIVDTDKNTIQVGTSTKSNAPSFGPMDKQATKDLSQRNRLLLTQLAEDAWREPPLKERPSPTADYDEILVVLDGNDAFYLEGFGPIREPLAAKAIIELRAAAGL